MGLQAPRQRNQNKRAATNRTRRSLSRSGRKAGGTPRRRLCSPPEKGLRSQGFCKSCEQCATAKLSHREVPENRVNAGRQRMRPKRLSIPEGTLNRKDKYLHSSTPGEKSLPGGCPMQLGKFSEISLAALSSSKILKERVEHQAI